MNQKIFIKTFGCQMNEYDSNRILDTVKKIGYEKTEKYEDANCYLLNTCHIRDKAKEKVYSEIGRVKKIFRYKKKHESIRDWNWKWLPNFYSLQISKICLHCGKT